MSEKQEQNKQNKGCSVSLDDCVHSRRCFMTGEYCSKQASIQKERDDLHKELISPKSTDSESKGQEKETKKKIVAINAFVIMNFSDMSDVMYKWRLKTYIESLAKYFYVSEDRKTLHCRSTVDNRIPDDCYEVDKIRVIRSDSDPASNYVICNRICQQMQIADLVVVDVSNQNTNVFYEFGMAVALGKMILPICYSESFYKRLPPEKDFIGDEVKEHHIGCYPWRKLLFEHYGILYKNKDNDNKKYWKNGQPLNEKDEDKNLEPVTHYLRFDAIEDMLKRGEKAKNKDKDNDKDNDDDDRRLLFDDVKYCRFPYHEKIADDDGGGIKIDNKGDGDRRLGKEIYNKLRRTYNDARSEDNTLVVYTMDDFLNRGQAGQCIVNFYKRIVSKMKLSECFHGDRVGVLVQENTIPEEKKEMGVQRHLSYSVGEIIHIGVNQATYLALGEKVKTEDFLTAPDKKEIRKDQQSRLITAIKGHIRNRAMLIYPDDPVYVNRIRSGFQKDILEGYQYPQENDNDLNFFCLYYVMLKNLKYTNEVVVDIGNNNTQALFWLGAAHGSDVYAVSVRHEATEGERLLATGSAENRERNVFDVAGLWTAVLHSYNTDSFYQQLYMAQVGIERHSKLMIKNTSYYENSIRDYLTSFREQSEDDDEDVESVRGKRRKAEMRILESYYRQRFWTPMLKYNRLRIYLPQEDITDSVDGEPRLHVVKWDMDAMGELSHYLSRRTLIGECRFETLRRGEEDLTARNVNFISIGGDLTVLNGKRLAKNIEEEISGNEKGKNTIHYSDIKKKECSREGCGNGCVYYKGFRPVTYEGGQKISDSSSKGLYTHHPCSECICCEYGKNNRPGLNETGKIMSSTEAENCRCVTGGGDLHRQIGQLILWRDISDTGLTVYRVELNGSSGPATLGLAALFIGTSEKEALLKNRAPQTQAESVCLTEEEEKEKERETEKRKYLLCDLQMKIRKKLMDAFFTSLDEKLRKGSKENLTLAKSNEEPREEQTNRYIALVEQAAALYLSTVLYRYFLPFLSEDDIKRICNSMENFIAAMMAGEHSPFSRDYSNNGDPDFPTVFSEKAVLWVARVIPEILENTLREFRGVEAFYRVTVRVGRTGRDGKEMQDTRQVMDIENMPDDVESVNCLFVSRKKWRRIRSGQMKGNTRE